MQYFCKHSVSYSFSNKIHYYCNFFATLSLHVHRWKQQQLTQGWQNNRTPHNITITTLQTQRITSTDNKTWTKVVSLLHDLIQWLHPPPYLPVNMHRYIYSAKHTVVCTLLFFYIKKHTHPFHSIPCSLWGSRSVGGSAKVTVEHRKERSEIMFSFPGAGR